MALPDDVRARLRTETGTFRAGERRRRFDPTLSVGNLAGPRASLTIPTRRLEYADRAVLLDWAAALLEEAPLDADTAWLSRAGATYISDQDVAFMVAAEGAFQAAGLEPPGCYVITREGWVDVRTGERRVWKRLRLDR